MPADHTLPGDVPGLVREGSVCRYNGGESIDPPPGSRMVVLWAVGDVDEHPAPNSVQAAFTSEDPCDMTDEGVWEVGLDCLSLDLSSETSRAHAAWWAEDKLNEHVGGAPCAAAIYMGLRDDFALVDRILRRSDAPDDIVALKALVLRLAGREG